jgi:hypothetical protein
MQPTTYEGGCHCGAIRFRIEIDRLEAIECNCSICTKKGFIHIIVPPDRFTLLQGEDSLATYTFNTGIAKHQFCRTCGIHPFYRPRSHPDCYDVNARCLDDNLVSQLEIQPFNGAHWEQNINNLRSRN